MKFYIKKLMDFAVTMFIVTAITFFIFNVLPGNPATIILGPEADEVQVQAMEKEFNLDKPLYIRYGLWLKNALKGDLGTSYRFQKNINSIISSSAGVTISLSFITILLTVLIGFPIGIFTGASKKKVLVKTIETADQIFISTPSFCTALILIIIFTVKLHLFPSIGFTPWKEDPLLCLKSLFLPSLSLALGSSAILARYLKTDFTEQSKKDYVKTAYSKGLSDFEVNINHILKNSTINVITTLGLILTEILGGSIIIENVFSLPGIGKLITTSISTRDFPLIQGLVLYLCMIAVICNFLVDILYTVIDPRIRISKVSKEADK